MQPQIENSRDGYGLRESALVAVLVVMVVLLRLLTNLLVIRMSVGDRTRGSHEKQAKHKANGSEMPQELPAKGSFNVSIETALTCNNEHRVACASQAAEAP